MKTEAIIFDLGGVLLDIDYQATISAFEELGFTDFQRQYSQATQSGLFSLLETGKIEFEDFCDQIRTLQPDLNLTNRQIEFAWCAMLGSFPVERVELLVKLRKQYPLYLLSNTNECHIQIFEECFKIEAFPTGITSLFDSVHYSSRMGMRKPNKDIFEWVLKEHNLNPETTVFIDDSIQHVEGAKTLGIDAHWLDLSKQNIHNLLIDLGIVQ